MNCDNPKVGMAGEALVTSHLLSLGLEVAPILGRDADLILKLGNRWTEIQVKSSIDGNFVSGTAWHAGTDKARRKLFTEYDVDGFAFCRLSSPYPYYIHVDAIRDRIRFPEYAFSRAERDRSWDEFCNRVTRRSEMTPGEVTEREAQLQMRYGALSVDGATGSFMPLSTAPVCAQGTGENQSRT